MSMCEGHGHVENVRVTAHSPRGVPRRIMYSDTLVLSPLVIDLLVVDSG